ncbi:MAG: hypothetical protein KGZ82_04160 [Bacteroidales bacterium]|nr:hypothetical protein [Bacteroidales bacterium]
MDTRVIPWAFSVVLLIVIIIIGQCHRCPESNPCPEPRTDLRTDSIPGDSVAKPYPEIKPVPIKIVYVEVPAKVDTGEILRLYHAEVYGRDTLANDSSVFVAVDWMVTKNRPVFFKPEIANRKPVAINHYTTYTFENLPENKYFAGFNTGRSPKSFGFGPSFALLTKKETLFTINCDLLNKDVYLTVLWKLNLSRKKVKK